MSQQNITANRRAFVFLDPKGQRIAAGHIGKGIKVPAAPGPARLKFREWPLESPPKTTEVRWPLFDALGSCSGQRMALVLFADQPWPPACLKNNASRSIRREVTWPLDRAIAANENSLGDCRSKPRPANPVHLIGFGDPLMVTGGCP